MSAGIRCMGEEGDAERYCTICSMYILRVCTSACLVERDSSNTTNSHV